MLAADPNTDEVRQCQFVAAITGFSLQIEQVDPNSKETKSANPSGLFPCVQTDTGAVSGVLAICKYMCRKSNKLLGSDAKETAQIN